MVCEGRERKDIILARSKNGKSKKQNIFRNSKSNGGAVGMKIKDDKSDALELIKDIKREMEVLKGYLATLEYLVYQCDERVEIKFFGKGSNGE